MRLRCALLEKCERLFLAQVCWFWMEKATQHGPSQALATQELYGSIFRLVSYPEMVRGVESTRDLFFLKREDQTPRN